MSARRTLAFVAVLLSGAVVPAAAHAAPDITLDKVVAPTSLYGSDIPVRLVAANPAGPGTGFNLSYRDVLPAGVSYVAGSGSPAPTVIANRPAAGQTTLIWENVADLAPNGDTTLAFSIRAATGSFDVGSTVTDTASAFVNADPRVVPAFDANGAPVAASSTGSATDTAATTLTAIDVVKTGPGALLRGVHANQYSFTLTTRNNGVRATNGVTVEDYLPAGLEFLGCGGAGSDNTTNSSTNPGSAQEYPGSGPIVVPTVTGCRAPLSVETVTIPAGGSPTLAAGVYTKVTWTVANLAPGATDAITYRAAVPIRENTATFGGTTPAPASGRQAANLDNNSGPETFDEQRVDNTAIARGTYQQAGGGQLPVTDVDVKPATAEDLLLAKSSSSGALVVGQITTWTLTATASEYRYVDDVRVRDVVPDGLCPLDATNRESDATPDCAGGAAFAPSAPYASIAETATGTWNLLWDQGTVPAFTRLQPGASASVSFKTRTRARYQEGFADAGPVLAGDAVTNTASVLGADFARCSGGAVDCGTGTKIFRQEPDGLDDVDAAAAGQSSTGPSIQKTTARPTAGGSCTGVTYGTAVLPYTPGDRVCFKLRVSFPAETSTGTRPLVDFLPPNVTYDAAEPPALTAANTLTGTSFDASSAADGILRWTLGTAPQTTPGAGRIFETTFAGRVVGAATYADGAVTGNLMKFTSVDTLGRAIALRDRVDLAQNIPLAIRKGVQSVNGNATGGAPGQNPANTDNVTVEGGDAVVYRVDLTNDSDKAITAGEVWDRLPARVTCALVPAASISDGGTCSTTGAQSFVKWSGLTLPAGSAATPTTRKLTYLVNIPATFSPGTSLPNTAGIRTYAAATNTGGTATYVPASNIDPALTAPNAPRADDASLVTLRGAVFTKSRSTSVVEAGNSDAQATIGETITYTVTANLPRNTTFVAGPRITDVVDARLGYVPASAAASTSSGASPALAVTGSTLTATLPDGYTTGAADVVLTLTFQARVLDVGANARGGSVPNAATLTYGDVDGGSRTFNANVSTALVEPQVALTKTNGAGGRASPGDLVTFTVTPANGSGAGVSTAHDARVVDTVPAGLTPLASGTTTPAATGDAVSATGGTWDAGARTITWTPTLAPGASVPLAYRVRVDDGVVGGAVLSNAVALTSSSLSGTVAGERTTGANYTATATSSVSVALASIAKSVLTPATATATVGQVVRYQLEVVIPAQQRFFDVSVRDAVPSGLDFVGYVSAACVAPCAPEIAPSTFTPVTAGPTTTAAWFLGDLEPAAEARTVRLTYDARVRATNRGGATPVADGDTLVNTATLLSNRIDRVPGTPTAAPATGDDVRTVTQTVTVREPKLTVDKAVGGQVADSDALTAQPAQALTYTVVVRNTGNAPAYDARVVDAPSARLTAITPVDGASFVTQEPTGADPALRWTIPGPIAPGASVTLTYTARLVASSGLTSSQTAVNTVDVPSYTSLPAGDPSGKSYDDVTPDTVTVTVDLPALRTVKTTGAGSAPFADQADARIGEPFAWRVTVTNDATVARAVGVDAIDVLPANWAYVPGSGRISSPTVPAVAAEPTIAAAAGGDTLTWANATDLGPGESLLVTFDARPLPAAATTPGLGTANANVNTARATGADASGATGDANGPYRSGDDAARAILRSPALAVTKTPDGGAGTAGTASGFTVRVANGGDAPATGVVVTDVLPAGLTYAPGTATATPAAGFSELSASPGAGGTTVITWRIASIAANAAVDITLPVAVPAAADPGSFVNRASATASERPDLEPSDTGSLAVTARADVGVTKTATPEPVVPGAELTYRLEIENLGPSDARAVRVVDALPSGTTFVSATPAEASTTCTLAAATVTCEAGRLTPGASRTVLVVVRVARTQTATLANTAVVSTSTPDPVTGNDQDTAFTTIAPNADLAVTKDAGRAVVLEGQTVEYTLRVTNAGPSTARAARVVDTLPAGLTLVSSTPGAPTCTPAPGAGGTTRVTCELGDLPDGASRTVLITARADVGSLGRRTNVAVVSSSTPDPVPGNDQDTADVIAGPAADLALVKTAPATIAAGGELSYVLRVTNAGPSAAQAVRVTDALPAGTTFASASAPQGACQEASGTVTCALGTLAARSSVDVTVVVAVPLALADRTLTNTASVQADNGDPDPANNTSSVVTQVGPVTDLSVAKSGPARSAPGQLVTWTLVVRNAGPSAASGVRLTDALPEGLTYVSAQPAQGTCSGGGRAVACELGSLASGGATQVLVTSRVADGLPPQRVTNTASVTGAEPDPDPANNAAAASTTIAGAPVGTADLRITKTPSTTRPLLGATLAYVIEVTNGGPATALGVTVTDTLPAALRFVSAKPSQGSCSGTATVTCRIGDVPVGTKVTVIVRAQVRAPGSVANSASVSAANPDSAPRDNIAVAGVAAAQRAARVTVRKRADRRRVVAGRVVTWTMTVRNTSKAPALGVVACDRIPAQTTLVSAGGGALQGGRVCWGDPYLAPGESFTVRLRTRVLRSTRARRVANVVQVRGDNVRTVSARARVAVDRAGLQPGVAGGVTG